MTTETKTMSLEEMAAARARANKKFDKLPAAQRRVKIAQDVLKLLDMRKVEASHCYFISDTEWKLPDDSSMQAVLPALGNCSVCAKGALLVASVELRNQVTLRDLRVMDWRGDPALAKALGGAFTTKQLDTIEDAYEHNYDRDSSGQRLAATVPYREQSYLDESSDQRLRAIMANIIKNRGSFCPSQEKNK